jgi:hypothetical protein
VLVPQVKEGAVTQGTPGQFSNAAFFQRTLISSTLNEALRSMLVPLYISCLFID